VGLRLVAQGEQGPAIEEISPDERAEILRQINEVVDRNRIKLEPGTFAIAAKRSGSGLPLLINAIAVAALIVTLFMFSWLFNRRQEVIASGSGTILTAESKLIEALQAESEQQLQQKDREIVTFQKKLEEILQEQRSLRSETENTLKLREQQLEADFQTALEVERQRLVAEGLGGAAVEERLTAFEKQRRAELDAEYRQFRSEIEERFAERESVIAGLVSEYEQSLKQAQEERSALQEDLEQRRADLERQFQEEAQALESDRARVAEQLDRLQEQQQQEQLVRDQMLSAYAAVNERIASGEYETALDRLESLRSYLDGEPARSLAGIQKRRPVELFIIGSLQELIRSKAGEQQELDSLIEANRRINELQRGVALANQRLEAGEPAAARALYLSALDVISSAREGYEGLAEIDSRIAARNRQLAESALAGAGSYYEEESFQASLDQFRRALEILLEDSDAASAIVDQIAEAGIRLRSREELPDRESIAANPSEEQAELLKRYEETNRSLESENRRLSEQLSRLEELESSLDSENTRLGETLARLQEQQRQEQLVQTAILDSYDTVNEHLQAGAYNPALEELSTLRSYLNEEPAVSLATIQQRAPVELFIIRSLEEMIRGKIGTGDRRQEVSRKQQQVESILSEGSASFSKEQFQASLDLYRQALELLLPDRATAERLVNQVAEAGYRLQAADELIALERARLVEEQRGVLRERLAKIEERYKKQRQREGSTSLTTPETLAVLLEAKLLVWQIIDSEPVSTDYPELYETMESYLETFGNQRMLDGRYAALEDMIAVVSALLDDEYSVSLPDVWRSYSHTDREDLLSRLLDKLELLIR